MTIPAVCPKTERGERRVVVDGGNTDVVQDAFEPPGGMGGEAFESLSPPGATVGARGF
jgi:hypothetical protein